MKKKYKQGEYEYYNRKRNWEIIKTVIYFAVSFSLLIAGYVATKTKANLLTIVAVLGLLPASKSCVSMVMYLRYHGCSKENHERLKDTFSHFLHAYGLVFTSYQKTYEVAGCIVKNGYIYGYLTTHQDMHEDLEAHIDGIVKRNGYKATIAMYTDMQEFLTRCEQIKEKEVENPESDAQLMELLHQISL
ncbi:MAG: hypothetical protein ACI4AA_10895 [Lachnospiraceae bacterium]